MKNLNHGKRFVAIFFLCILSVLFLGCPDAGTPGSGTVVAPAFSPSANTFTASLDVSLATTTTDATIYYSTAGAIDASSYASAVEYTAPFTITETATIHAIAVKGTDTSSVVNKTYTRENISPVVSAGSDVTDANVGNQIQLAGTATDGDGDSLTILWSATSVPDGATETDYAFSATDILNPVFTVNIEGDFTLTLTASDGSSSISDTMEINVARINNTPAAALISSASMVTALDTSITFTGTGTDSDAGEVLSYSWEITSQPAGSTVSPPAETATYISGAASGKDITLTTEGEYIVSFTVTDSLGASDTDVVTVTVDIPNASGNSQPVAAAGNDEVIDPSGGECYLDGSSSADPDSDRLTHTWTVSSMPQDVTETIIDFLDSGDGTAHFDSSSPPGDYTFELTVDDRKGFDGTDGTNESSTDTDTVTITVSNNRPSSINISSAPSAVNIDPDYTGSKEITISTNYNDNNGGETHEVSIEYASAPAGSSRPAFQLDVGSSSIEDCELVFIFMPDAVGTYEIFTRIVDGTYTEESSSITITAYDNAQGGINVEIQ